MPNSLLNNHEFALVGGERMSLYDILKVMKEKIVNRSGKLIIRRSKANNASSHQMDESQVNKRLSFSYVEYANPILSRFNKKLQLFSKNEIKDIDFDFKKMPKNFKQKKIRSHKAEKTEEILGTYDKKITSNDLLEQLEFARKLGDDRIHRANAYSSNLLRLVKSKAMEEIVEFILNDLKKEEIAILIGYGSNLKYINDSYEFSLSEVYLQARSKATSIVRYQKNQLINESCTKNRACIDGSDNDLEYSINALSDLKLQGNSDLNKFLNSLGTNSSFIESTTDYLISRTCDVSLEIERNLIGSLNKNNINVNTGVHRRGIRK
ncbi:hypothetical protein OIY81_978 [Cryptosporidium canis]|nr:hypothetical protein OIY81_978 [Cryptosporidium canis]